MRRTIQLFRLFLAEQSEPEKFYTTLAADSIGQVDLKDRVRRTWG